MKIKAKGDGKKRKRENIVKKAPNLLNLYFGWVLSTKYIWHIHLKTKKGNSLNLTLLLRMCICFHVAFNVLRNHDFNMKVFFLSGGNYYIKNFF